MDFKNYMIRYVVYISFFGGGVTRVGLDQIICVVESDSRVLDRLEVIGKRIQQASPLFLIMVFHCFNFSSS